MSTATLEHLEHPPIAHERTRVSTGKLGMWWFLASEIVTFGGVVTTYTLMRLNHPDWLKHSSQTLLPIGAANTVVLLTSSLTMVLAHATAQHKDRVKATRYLLATLLLACVFLGFKSYEYHHEINEGLVPSAGVFWAFYFAMTGLHGLHVIAGMVAMVAVIFALKRDKFSRVEVLGLYWHFVDLVWIFLSLFSTSLREAKSNREIIMQRENTEHGHPNYLVIYFALLALLGVSVVLGHISNVYLMTGLVFGVATIKALMVLRYFMHLKFEPLFIGIILISAVLCLVILFLGVYPDAVLRSGWK